MPTLTQTAAFRLQGHVLSELAQAAAPGIALGELVFNCHVEVLNWGGSYAYLARARLDGRWATKRHACLGPQYHFRCSPDALV